MTLFMKEHALLIVMQCIQWTFLGLLLILSGFENYQIMLYGLLVSVFWLVCYLLYHYYTRRHIYKKLSTRPADLDQLLEATNSSPLGQAVDEMSKSHYALFMEQLGEAEQMQASHLTFIDRWVHQMKTPLSVIELTAQQLDEPESSSVREETERMKHGLETVLYMARMRALQEDFHVQPVHLHQLIQEVTQENKRFFIRNDVYPDIKVENKYMQVESDEKWLFFIIDQLVQNAVKYSTGKSKRISLSVSIENEAAVLTVSDEGVGIPIHDQKRIFQAFFTGDNGRMFRESTGMGLYLVREVLDYMGHQIEMESTLGMGTTFRIRFTREQTRCS